MVTEYALGFAFDPGRSRVVLIEKKRPAWQAGLLNGVGGHVESDELPIQTMVREFQEETGVQTKTGDWNWFGRLDGSNSKVYVYRAFIREADDVQTTTDEKVDTYWVSDILKSYDFDCVPNLQFLISDGVNNKS